MTTPSPADRQPATPPATPTPAAGQGDPADRLAAVHARLFSAVADLASGDGWQQMLRTAAALPSYSPHNVLLITSQCPHARAVAGFHTWKTVGRTVRKGEKGLAILAPVLRSARDRSGPTEGARHPVEQPAPAVPVHPRDVVWPGSGWCTCSTSARPTAPTCRSSRGRCSWTGTHRLGCSTG